MHTVQRVEARPNLKSQFVISTADVALDSLNEGAWLYLVEFGQIDAEQNLFTSQKIDLPFDSFAWNKRMMMCH
jgi:hypothetical protein